MHLLRERKHVIFCLLDQLVIYTNPGSCLLTSIIERLFAGRIFIELLRLVLNIPFDSHLTQPGKVAADPNAYIRIISTFWLICPSIFFKYMLLSCERDISLLRGLGK